MTIEELCKKAKTFPSNTDPMNIIGKVVEYYYEGKYDLGTVLSADDNSFFVNGIWVPNSSLEEVICKHNPKAL